MTDKPTPPMSEPVTPPPWAAAKPELYEMFEKARKAYEQMTPEQKAEMWRAQRRSFIRGEAGMGSDADEAAYRRASRNGDLAEMKRLDAEAKARAAAADKWMDG